MVLKVILFLLLAVILGVTAYLHYLRRQMGMDTMNVYRLRLGGTPVFTRLNRFLRAHGLPPEVRIGLEEFPVRSPQDFDELLADAVQKRHEIDLCYEGFRMNYFAGSRLIISSIDFRRAERPLLYDGWVLDGGFTTGDFAELFPLSARMGDVHRSAGIQSCFELTTGESGFDKETYMVGRWSKDNIFAHPTVEFTFEEGRLIYISSPISNAFTKRSSRIPRRRGSAAPG